MTTNDIIEAIKGIEQATPEDSPAEYLCNDLVERLSTHVPPITYPDPFDEKHYAARDEHRDAIQAVADALQIDHVSGWECYATIHGLSFHCVVTPRQSDRLSRMYADMMRRLLAIPGFRYFEIREMTLVVGVSHVIVQPK